MHPTKNPDSESIRRMFDNLAGRYDLFNHLTSLGLATQWRRQTLMPVKPGMRVLDLGCGTGDLALAAIRKMGTEGEVVGIDFSANMLAVAKKRYEATGLNGRHALRFELKKAEDLPLQEASFDLVVSGFVLRNLYENIESVLGGVYRSLKDGGRISFLDLTEPPSAALRGFWRLYMNTVVALYGRLLFGRRYPEFYLTQSAERFLKAPEFMGQLRAAGFRDVRSRSFLFGIIRLYEAVK